MQYNPIVLINKIQQVSNNRLPAFEVELTENRLLRRFLRTIWGSLC